MPDVHAWLLVPAAGYGAAWERLVAVERDGWEAIDHEYDRDIHLVEDLPIVGRLVGPDGKPVANAIISVATIISLADEQLAPLRAAIIAANPSNWKLKRVIPAIGAARCTKRHGAC